mmetsp:Transcript_107566/g.343172  ORF Transcript_107566/g.343172 Transcript_107566/m.343172 type:complete len:259 (+) Transcript_107566:1405-2181(+)
MLLPDLRAAVLSTLRAFTVAVFATCTKAARTASVAAFSRRSAVEAREASFVSSTLDSKSTFLAPPLKPSCVSCDLATTALASATVLKASSAAVFRASSSPMLSSFWSFSAVPAFALATMAAALASAASTASAASATTRSAKALHLPSCTFFTSSCCCCTNAARAAATRFFRASARARSVERAVRICWSLPLTSTNGPCLTCESPTVFWSTAWEASVHRWCTALTKASMLSILPTKGGEAFKHSKGTHTCVDGSLANAK